MEWDWRRKQERKIGTGEDVAVQTNDEENSYEMGIGIVRDEKDTERGSPYQAEGALR